MTMNVNIYTYTNPKPPVSYIWKGSIIAWELGQTNVYGTGRSHILYYIIYIYITKNMYSIIHLSIFILSPKTVVDL